MQRCCFYGANVRLADVTIRIIMIMMIPMIWMIRMIMIVGNSIP